MDHGLPANDRSTLLDLARKTIGARLACRPAPRLDQPSEPLTRPCGAFVTLKIGDQLRGCIGHITGIHPLWRSIRDNAIAAAFEDPRFSPLETEELTQVRIEISVLSPLTRIDDPEDIVVGQHGVLVQRSHSRGLLLPQVAIEHRMDRGTFLDRTCRKAGLPRGCWRDPDVTLHVFTAEVFGEER